MQPEILTRLLERDINAHKYNFGHVLVIGGAPGMVGAPFMAAMAALRTGAGLVTIASHPEVINKLESRVAEIMTFCIAHGDSAVVDLENLIDERRVSVAVMGPGAGPELCSVLLELLPNLHISVVIDAGMLNALSDNLDVLDQATASNSEIIITPHAGEFAKLTKLDAVSSLDERIQQAQKFASNHKLTVVLKGHKTNVAHPDGSHSVNETGNPGMATAGTGDVLSGIIGGLLGQKLPMHDASVGGVYLHGLAGDITAGEKTQPGTIATDIIGCIPKAYASLQVKL